MRSVVAIAAVTTLLAWSVASLKITSPKKGRSSSAAPHTLRLGRTVEHVDRAARTNTLFGPGSNLPVGGSIWPLSVFWTWVEVGTPAVKYAVTIDSGSFALYIPGQGCQGCIRTPPNQQYKASASSTSMRTGRNFSASYLTCDPTKPLETCTINGTLYTDVATLAGYGPGNVTLGAIEVQTSNFYQFHTIDGIMGMVGNTSGNVYNQLCVAGDFCSPVWAICLNEGTTSNGTMTVGGIDETLSKGPIQYVPRLMPHVHYWLTVKTLWVGGHSIGFNSGAPLDTGTNDLLLPTALFNHTHKTMCNKVNNLRHCEEFFKAAYTGGTECFELTEDEVDAYPNLSFDLENNVTLMMSGRDYLLKGSPIATSPKERCFGIGNGGSLLLFGDSIMQNYYLVFAPDRIGWGEVNRNTCGSK